MTELAAAASSRFLLLYTFRHAPSIFRDHEDIKNVEEN